MKSVQIIMLSLLFMAICAVARKIPTIVPQVPVHEVLPLPINIRQSEDNPNKYTVESTWYGSGYEDDGTLKRITLYFVPWDYDANNRFFIRQNWDYTQMRQTRES